MAAYGVSYDEQTLMDWAASKSGSITIPFQATSVEYLDKVEGRGMEQEQKMSTLDILLGADLPDMRKNLPEQQVEVPRLSRKAGKPVIFTLRALSYDKVREIQDRPRSEQALYGVLYGCVDPSWKDSRLMDHGKGIVTPPDAIKAKLASGEIDELYAQIQKLSGYLRRTLRDVKND